MNTLATRSEFNAFMHQIDPDCKLTEEERKEVICFHEETIAILQQRLIDYPDPHVLECAIAHHRAEIEELTNGDENGKEPDTI